MSDEQLERVPGDDLAENTESPEEEVSENETEVTAEPLGEPEYSVSADGAAPAKKIKGPVIVAFCAFIAVIIGVLIFLGFQGKKAGDKDANGKIVKIGDYKNFLYDKYSSEVTDEEVTDYLNQLVEYYSSMGTEGHEPDTEHEAVPVAEGDVLNIDYVGTIDGEAFSGGTANGAYLQIGSGRFIPGFEEGLIGANVGDTVTLNLTFPEDYSNTDLAGKAAVFTVTINGFAKTVPLTAENLVTEMGYESLDAVKEDLKSVIAGNKQSEEDYITSQVYTYATQVVGLSEFGDISEEVQSKYDSTLKIYSDAATNYGYTLEAYVTSLMGYESLEAFQDKLKENCEIQVKSEILFAQIAKDEGIVITDDEYKEALYEAALSAGYNETDESGNADIDATNAVYVKDYEDIYGEGSLEANIRARYYERALFDKYATALEK